MTRDQLERVLGRPERPAPLPLDELAGERVLVTGAAGSIGTAVGAALALAPVARAVGTDIVSGTIPCDVTDADDVEGAFALAEPTLVLHLAAAKSAPDGERNPVAALEVNAVGTRNVLDAAERAGARVVTASTCKACDPETAYGASKLLAERMTLQAGGSVARFYNVVESSGNVFQTWAGLPEDEPLPVTFCSRYFISLREAVSLLLNAAVLPAGRYAFDPGGPQQMRDVAARLYPRRRTRAIAARRGDRLVEPFVADSENVTGLVRGVLCRVESAHDRQAVLA